MNKEQKWFRNYFLILIFLLCVLMISSTAAMISSFSQMIEKEAKNNAYLYVTSTANDVVSSLSNYKTKVEALVSDITNAGYENVEEFHVKLERACQVDGRHGYIMWIRYFKDGVEYNTDGDVFDPAKEAPIVKRKIEEREFGCVGLVTDKHFALSAAAYTAPIENFEYADAIAVYYPVYPVVSNAINLDRDDFDLSLFHVVVAQDGEIVDTIHTGARFDFEYGNVLNILREDTNEKTLVDDLMHDIDLGNSTTYVVNVNGDKCVVGIAVIRETDNTSFAVIGFYRAEDINNPGYTTIKLVLGEFLVFFICVLGLVIYGFVHTIRTRSKIAEMTDLNKELECPTRHKFEKVSAEIMNRNKATNFAFVVIEMAHFDYIYEQIGSTKMVTILKRLLVFIVKNLGIDETYAYADHGRFLMLCHFREISDLENRLTELVLLSTQYGSQVSGSIQLTYSGGIYTTNRKIADTTPKMIDLAIAAQQATQYPCDFSVFRMYNEMLHSSSIQNDFIEVHMESALANQDFKVFYQPKFNIVERKIEGCEALVRWYNPELDEYMQPAVFLPLFEANRFIIKLDHYVFEQACLYIEDAIASGLPLVPVSVNASRITASDRDFVNYCVNMKKQHNILDGFITIEFTESFAYEDYDMLREIVAQLHQNGIKCSIDDFGSGFSSYSILKELPMDEIKLDSFFIREGFSKERDLAVLSSIIKLGRELHMKVTQEGVEHDDQVKLLRNLGCQVVQGYYYSRPLSLTEYIRFLTKQTSS